METCRPQQSIHVDQFFVSRLSIVWLKKVKRDEKKRLVWKKQQQKNENAKKKCLQEERFQFNRKRGDNCMLSDAKNGELIKNNV